MSIGFWQVVLIVVVVLIIFGAGKLPKVMGDLAKGLRSFKEGMKEEETPSKKTLSRIAAPLKKTKSVKARKVPPKKTGK